MQISKLLRVILLFGLACSWAVEGARGAGGREGLKTTFYTSAKRGEDPNLLVTASLESVSFSLSSVQNKFKLVPIEIDNRGAEAVKLSRAKDFLNLCLADRKIPATLDLAKADAATWDSLDQRLREILDYPETVEPRSRIAVYVFFKAPELRQLPASFEYNIQSLGRPLQIAPPPAVAAGN